MDAGAPGMATIKIAAIIPSRGMAFSKTVEELYSELDATGHPYKVYWSHYRPIPECFTVPTEEALKDESYTHFLFIEDDMVLTPGIVKRLLEANTYAVTCDYPVGGGSGGTVMYDPEGRAFFTGCGLLLVEAWLLRKLPKPIWRSDMRWKPYVEDGLIHFTLSTNDDPDTYGQQDVAFGLRLYANGYPIQILDETIGQREMVKKGEDGSNQGFHVVEDRMEVVPRRDLELIQDRVRHEEIIIDGKRVKISKEMLAKLPFEPERPDYTRSLCAVFDAPDDLKDWLLFDGAR